MENEEKKPAEKKMCSKCGENPAKKPHACPYAVEIKGDHKTRCTCCDACRDRCRADI